MDISKYDVYAYQIMQYLITSYHYQVIHIKQHKDDIWLANAEQEMYPVIRLSSKATIGILNDKEYIRNVHQAILSLLHREGPILIFNTNPNSTPIDDLICTQICIQPGSIDDKKIVEEFPELANIVKDVDDLQAEFINITRTIEEAQLLIQEKSIARTKSRMKPTMTKVILGVFTVYALLTFGFTFLVDNRVAGWVAMGAYYKMNIIAAHEYWRFLTSIFVQGDIVVFAFHAYALFQIGKMCEPIYKKREYLMIFIIGCVVGNMCLLIGSGNTIGFGFGAGIFSISGAYLAAVFEDGSYKHPFIRLPLAKILILDIVVCILPGLSFMSHIGGFLIGLLLGFAFLKNVSWRKLRKHAIFASVILLSVLSYFSIRVNTVSPLNISFDSDVVDIYWNTEMHSYAKHLQECYNIVYRLE